MNPLPISKSFLCTNALSEIIEDAFRLSHVHCQLIKGTIRDTYRVWSSEGDFVLCVYQHLSRNSAEIESELDLIEHLDREGVSVGPPIRPKDDARMLALEAPEGLRHGVLFAYIHGDHLSRTPSVETVAQLGSQIARIHSAADSMKAAINRPCIDFNMMVQRPIEAFREAVPHRAESVAYLKEVCAILEPRICSLEQEKPFYGLLHGDVSASNTKVSPSGAMSFLDFDFCGLGWRVYDVATYFTEVMYWKAPEENAEAFLKGYQEIRPLRDWELQAIPAFAAARNIFSLGTPALYINAWGSASFPDSRIDLVLDCIRRNIEELD